MDPRSLTCSLILAAVTLAQDPPPPPVGFDVTVTTHAVTWSDGYLSMMDLYVPVGAPPATGWPGVLALHGGDGTRAVGYIPEIGQYLGAAGYVVYAYDVRGNGVTSALNPGVVVDPASGDRLRDAAEAHAQANGFSGGVVDLSRLAVTGFSGGCLQSWEAAAWSGKPIPPTYTVTYPVISAVFGWGGTLDRPYRACPGGVIASANHAVATYEMDPTGPDFLMLQAQDYTGAAAALAADPLINPLPELQTSTVPLFGSMAWHDRVTSPSRSVDVLQLLPAGTPRRYALTTDGHGTPKNLVELDLKQLLRRQWFDRFLKNIPNGADLAPTVDYAVFPSDHADYLDVASHWGHGTSGVWPPPLPGSTRYLRAGGGLQAAAPPTVETGPVVQNLPAPGYDLIAFCQSDGYRSVGAVLASLPLDTESFTTSPLLEPREIVGRPQVDLWVDSTTGSFQVTAALHRVGAGGETTFLTLGTGAVRGGAPGRHQVTISMSDCATVIPAGEALRVVVQNVARYEPPGIQRIWYVPEFTSYDLTIVMEPGQASSLHLPTRAPAPRLTPAVADFSAALGVTHALDVQAGPGHAGFGYLVALGASGSWPGTTVAGTTVPVNWDPFTDLGLLLATIPNPSVNGLLGVLDPAGGAQVQITLDPTTASLLEGQRITFGAVVAHPTTAALQASAGCHVVVHP